MTHPSRAAKAVTVACLAVAAPVSAQSWHPGAADLSKALDTALALAAEVNVDPPGEACRRAAATLLSVPFGAHPELSWGNVKRIEALGQALEPVCARGANKLEEYGLMHLIRAALVSPTRVGGDLAGLFDRLLGTYWTLKLKRL